MPGAENHKMSRTLKRRDFLKATSLTALSLGLTGALKAADKKAARPNILWITAEDMNAWMSCYGETVLKTPTFDALAAGGVRFDRAYVPAPVCSACRSGTSRARCRRRWASTTTAVRGRTRGTPTTRSSA